MFEEGKLLRFDPFIFKNGATPKPKYFLVLKQLDNRVILASLPTSKDHIPSDIAITTGCVEDSTRQISAFVFKANDTVVEGNAQYAPFQFPRHTFIYCSDVDSYPVEGFETQLSEGKTTVTDLGFLRKELYEALLACLQSSSMIKRRYKKLLVQ